MRRLATLLAAGACVGLLAAPAQAKELRAAAACGARGCTRATDPALLHRLIRLVESEGEPVSAPVPAPAPFYRIDFSIRGDGGHGPSFSQYYVPGVAATAIQTGPSQWTWVRVDDSGLLRLYDRLVRGTKPFAAPVFVRARVNGKPVAGAASYALLLTIDGKGEPNLDRPDWIPIELETARPSPWATGTTQLEYSPSAKMLWRGDEFVALPDSLATAIEQRRPLRLPEKAGFPWLALPAGLGIVALAGAGFLTLRRRRDGPQPS